MKYDHFNHRRSSIRLKGYDYAQAGAYFVTNCLQGNQRLLGQVIDGDMITNAAGDMVFREWLTLAERFETIELDTFVVMPNHIHGIILIHDLPIVTDINRPAVRTDVHNYTVGAGLVPAHGRDKRASTRGAPTSDDTDRPTLGVIIGAYKSLTTNRYISGIRNLNWPPFNKRLWQRNYYEHIIRNERAYKAIRAYINNNPANWTEDQSYPANS